MNDTPAEQPPGFATLAVHAGAQPDAATGARATPIYQTTSYVFKDADHAARLFGLQEVGYIYSRLTNPTVGALQNRIAALEGGAGAVCCSSGHAAQIMALFPLMGPGLNLVASAIILWNTVYLGRAVDHLRHQGVEVPERLLAHVAPLGWEHVSLTGDYLWNEIDRPLERFRPIRANRFNPNNFAFP